MFYFQASVPFDWVKPWACVPVEVVGGMPVTFSFVVMFSAAVTKVVVPFVLVLVEELLSSCFATPHNFLFRKFSPAMSLYEMFARGFAWRWSTRSFCTMASVVSKRISNTPCWCIQLSAFNKIPTFILKARRALMQWPGLSNVAAVYRKPEKWVSSERQRNISSIPYHSSGWDAVWLN